MKFKWSIAGGISVFGFVLFMAWYAGDSGLRSDPRKDVEMDENRSVGPKTSSHESASRSTDHGDSDTKHQEIAGDIEPDLAGSSGRQEEPIPAQETPNLETRPQDPSKAFSALELQDAARARGRPFPLSPSISKACASAAESTSTSILCIGLMNDLEKFKKEERNLLWASETEERLERAIEKSAPGKFSIRALECRSNWCAVEVASAEGSYGGELSGDPELAQELWPLRAVWQYEKSPEGWVRVSVFTFLRGKQ